ncbi:MAG: glycosyltransferase family 1 protein [Sideroxyarcus sp.]
MKIILSIDTIKYPLTGTGRYTYELIRQLESMGDISSLRYFRGWKVTDAIPAPQETANSRGSFISAMARSRAAIALYGMVMPKIKARALASFEDYIFHGTSFYLPKFPGSSVATIHDLSMYSWADCHPPERVRFMREEIELTLGRAGRLITDSEYTRHEVAQHFNWPLEKVHAISLGCGAEFHPRSHEDLLPVLSRYRLEPGGYTLFTGTIEPRKNLDALLTAYGRLTEAVRNRWPLVLTGYQGWGSQAIHDRIAQGEREGWLRYLGYLPSAELPLLMAGARLFAYPSLYEGFGLPVLEAMASGTPVVCSNSSSLPEVAGDAAAMCPPGDIDSLHLLLQSGLEDETWRTEAINKGLARAAMFSWARCAEKTISVYRALEAS